jgi:hypothetical protein
MKKIISITIILLLATALFADGVISVNLGGAFSFVSAKNPHCPINKPTDILGHDIADYDLTLEQAAGFGFDAGFVFKLSSDYNMYLDFGMTFPSKVKVGEFETLRSENIKELSEYEEDYEYFSSFQGKAFMTNIEFHVGFTRNIVLNNSPFALSVGGGFGYRMISSGFQFTARLKDEETKKEEFFCFDLFERLSHISFDFNVTASYKLSNRFSVGLTLMPGVTFYSSSKFYVTTNAESKNIEPIPSKDYYTEAGMKPKYENSGFAAGFCMSVKLGVSYTF